jgi:predicted helicase
LPAQFFWATNQLPLDGILRSDQRGNETVLPLWLDEHGVRRANFSAAWLERVTRLTGLEYGENSPYFSPEHSLGYIYSQFFSPAYREMYQAGIVHDYPRVPDPCDADDFLAHAERGCKLLQWHTSLIPPEHSTTLAPNAAITSGYPRWAAGRVRINDDVSVAEVEESVWNLSLGAHQVARKWLKDRRGRYLTESEIAYYRRLVKIVQVTEQTLASERSIPSESP